MVEKNDLRQYKIVLSWHLLDWMMEGIISCSFTNFITTQELSGVELCSEWGLGYLFYLPVTLFSLFILLCLLVTLSVYSLFIFSLEYLFHSTLSIIIYSLPYRTDYSQSFLSHLTESNSHLYHFLFYYLFLPLLWSTNDRFVELYPIVLSPLTEIAVTHCHVPESIAVRIVNAIIGLHALAYLSRI